MHKTVIDDVIEYLTERNLVQLRISQNSYYNIIMNTNNETGYK